MSKVAEGLLAKMYEGMPKKKVPHKEKGERSRDFWGPHPTTWKTVRYVSEEECREVNEKA